MNAGVFFTFSTFTMRGLQHLAPAAGATAMQEINREAPRPPLMLLMFGTAALSVALIVNAAGNINEPASVYRLIASALFLVGVLLMTGLYHVPRNNRLDRLDATSPEGSAFWTVYLQEWVRMNHVRTFAPLVAALLLALSLNV
jgi:uncharacterized membrane protein